MQVPSKEQVRETSQVLFDQLHKRLGKVPNLYAVMGYSPIALQAFMDFEATLNTSVFTPKEREAVALVVSEVNGCAYCLAAHTMLAVKRGFTQEDTMGIRRGEAEDVKLHAIIRLAKEIAENKGHVAPVMLNNFYQVGFDEAAVMELIGLVTVRVFTNYVYALTDIPVDFPAALPL